MEKLNNNIFKANLNNTGFKIFLFIVFLMQSFAFQAATYYSQGTNTFSTLANWNTNPGGGGSSPIAGDLTSGLNGFVIQDVHVVTLDQDISISSLTIGGGASGRLTIGNSVVARTIAISGNLSVLAGARFDVGNFDAVHTLTIGGSISNASTLFDLENVAVTRVCNVVMNGTTYPTISGSQTPVFYGLTLSGGAAGTGIDRIITVAGNFLITNSTPVTTAFGHTITGSFTVAAGSSFTPSAGTMTFNGASTQAIDVSNATFTGMTFSTGNKTITGNITCVGNVRINTGVILSDAAPTNAHTITGTFDIYSTGACNFLGTVAYAGTLRSSHNFDTGTLANPTSMGTATWTFTGNVTTGLLAPATNARFDFNGDLTINAGTTNIINNTHFYSTSNSSLTLNNAAILQISGLIGANTNFPENFLVYDFSSTSTVRYNGAGAQIVKGGASLVNGYGILDVRNNTKTCDGNLVIFSNLLLNVVTADFSGFDVNLGGSTTITGACVLTNDQTFTLDAPDAAQTLATGCTYTFNNLVFTQTAPTATRIKTIGANLTINGDFTVTNAGGSNAIYNEVNLQAFTISDGVPSGTWTLGSNVRLYVSGTGAEFQNSLDAFTTIDFDDTYDNYSVVRFNNTTVGSNQNIPYQNTTGPFSYGTIEFNGSGGAGNNKIATGSLDINGNILSVGNTPHFDDGNFSHTVAGNWFLYSAYYPTPGAAATITLDGTNTQNIGSSVYSSAFYFPNLVIANTSDIVSIEYTLAGGRFVQMYGDLTINTGAHLDANTRSVYIQGDWIQLGTGIYTQTSGTTLFNSTAVNQSIDIATPATSYFGNLTITKNAGGAPQTLTANTDFTVSGAFTFTTNQATFDANGRTISIGGNWNFAANTFFTSTGSTILFNGTSTQTITNSATTKVFNNISFSGGGAKNFNNSAITVEGDFNFTGANVSWGGATTLTLEGNWINTGGTGTFTPSTGTVLLNGGAQNVGASSFYNLTCAGTALSTKTLTGNIVLNNAMTINVNITLDVSASNYSIGVSGAWVNNGTFTPHNGTVTLTNNTAAITTGTGAGPTAGKNFYNLTLAKTAGQSATFAAGSDLVVTNDLTITSGTLSFATSSDCYVGGDFSNAGIYTSNNNNCVLTLNNALSAVLEFDPGTSGSNIYRDIIVSATGATYTLENNLTIGNGRSLTINGGTFILNGNTLSMTGGAAITVITVGAGTLDVDTGSILQLANTNIITINNASSVFKVVGSASSYATVTTNGSAANGYNINQSAGVFHAKYFTFSNLRTTGIVLSGTATIDATNNISNGSFTAPATTGCTQYLDVSGIDLTSVNSVDNCQFVSFATGATNNIKCTSAPIGGTMTFQYASGALAGESNDNDAAAYIDWTNTPGVFWTGGAATTNWYDDANWSSGLVPLSTEYVFLDHSTVGGAYQVDIATPGAICAQLNIDAGGGAAITLAMSGTGDLTVEGNVNIYTGTTLSTATVDNIIYVTGGWSNTGTLTATNGTVDFNGTSGTSTITTGASAFNNLSFTGAGGATYQLGSNITINGDFSMTNNTLDVSNYDIVANGDWSITGSGSFNPQTRTVTLSKAGASNQDITGGYFYNLSTSNATGATTSTKTLLSATNILGSLTIGSAGAGTTQIIGGTFSHFVYGNWTNNHAAGYDAGTSTVYFSRTTTTQTIGGTQPTTFNNVTMEGAGAKTLAVNATAIDGNWQVSSGSGQVNINAGVNITNAGGSGIFTIAGATTLMVMGSFPTTFETVNLNSTSTVHYEQNGAANVYNTTYGVLTLSSLNNGTPTTKTALGDISAVTVNQGTAGADNAVTFDMAGYTLTLTGITLTQQTGAPQIIWGATGSLIQNGAGWNIDADITGFNNLTLAGTGSKTMNSNFAITGDVIIQNGATLVMGVRTMTGAGTESFTMQAGSALNCAITATVAFPTGFGSYTLDPTSTVTLNGAADQTIQCKEAAITITYGNLTLSPSVAATNENLNEDLYVAGNFTNGTNAVIVDNNFDMYFSGTNTDIRNYTQSAATTINLIGGTQSLYDGVNNATLALANITFGGTAGTTKTLGTAAGVGNTVNLTGTIIINANITLTSARNINYSGTSWTNSGTFTHTNNTFTFNGVTTQNIIAGTNTYRALSFTNTFNPGVVFATDGINVTTTTAIGANARVDMGGAAAPAATLTHTFGGAITNLGYWITTNAHLVLNGGNYAVPVNDAVTAGTTFTARNITIGAGTKSMAATTTWDIEDLNLIGNLNPGAAANTLNIRGNWNNTAGTFTHNNNTVNFNGNNTIDGTVSITVNASTFYVVNFSPSNAVSYTMQSATATIQSDMTIGSNATLNLNSTTLTLGRSAAVVKTYTVNGILYVNENSSLRFDNRGSAVAGVSQCQMTVTGAGASLRVVGSSSAQVAAVTAVTGGTQAAGYYTSITVTAGAEIQAKYYTFEYLADAGLVVTSTAAAMHAVNNFSEGTWQYMNTAVAGAATRYYLDCDAPSSGVDIVNVTFNWSGAIPVPANRFNVKRTGAATGVMAFNNTIAGTLGSFQFEDDDLSATTGQITWPDIITATWVGSISSDFNDANNWSTLLAPDLTTNCIIPAVIAPNYTPIIDATSGAAVIRDLTITNGRLDCNGGIIGVDLEIKGSITIGSTGAGILAVGNSDCTIEVDGAWTRGATAGTSFIHGSGTVSFNAISGAYTIDPKTTGNYAFGNVEFNGAISAYNITGGLTATGDLTINNATVNPANTITINIAGDYTNNGGTFTASPAVTSTVVLNGTNQTVSEATFYNLTVSNSGTKTMLGTNTVYNNTIINTGCTLEAPGGADVLTLGSGNAGTMTINGTGVFSDGGGSHFFNGTTWTASTSSGTGSSGTITFNRTAAQTVAGGNFNNLSFTSGGNITISADVLVTGSASVNLTGGNNLTLNNNYSINGNNTFGVFTLGANHTMNVNGTDNCPSGFAAYALDATTTTNYTQAFDQTIGAITYGTLTLNTSSVKTLEGDIIVQGNLNIQTSSLDVSASNYQITVGGNFNNNSTGSLLSNGGNHAGTIVLNGAGAQNVNIGSIGSKGIYNLEVSKSGGTATLQTNDLTVFNDFIVTSGTFTLNTRIGYVGGDFMISGTGAVASSGTFNLNATGGSPLIQMNGSGLNILVIDAAGITYTAQDALRVNGNFTLTAGTLDGDGQYIYLGNTAGRTINIAAAGTYIIGEGGTMGLGPTAAVTVDGTLEAVGSSGSSVATITKNTAGSTYSFTVNGTIKAQYYLFEYMGATGFQLTASAIIDPVNNFSDGTFTNGGANCKYLTVGNTETHTINNVSFPVVPTGTVNNVVKSTAGVLTFYNATGTFSGASYESDDGSATTGAIRWTGPTTYTWIGATSIDWFTATNWSSSLGGNGVPTAADNAIIATNAFLRQPTINASGAVCKNLTINTSTILTLATGAGVSDLVVDGDVSIDGSLVTSSDNDYMEVSGNWTKAVAATVNLTAGTITFNGTSSKTINNGTGQFQHLTINAPTGTYLLGSNTTINGDMTITAGTLDVSGTFYNVTVKGAWINSGTFNARLTSTATVTLNSATVGAVVLNPGSSSFNRLTINGAATTVYTLTSNDLSVAGNLNITTSELFLNGLTLNMGDNVGTDILTVSSTAILNIDANAFLKMGTGSSVAVNSGGTVRIVGTDASNVATVTKQVSGTVYAFAVNSGATIHAQYYLFEYMNTAGIVVNAGASIDATNDFRNGTFSNGAATGKFLVLLNDFADYTVDGVAFNTGPAYSVSRTSGTGNITFHDPTGSTASYLYEEDDAAYATGLVRWTYTNPQLTWTGAVNTDWEETGNWATTGPPGPPDNTMDVTIPNTVNDPVLTANAFVRDINIGTGATLTMGAFSMDVNGSFTNNAGTFTSTGTVNMIGATASPTINTGGSSFYNLVVNGGVNYNSASSITVANNFTISPGASFTIANSAHALTITGNWTSTGGTFTHGSGTVTMNENSGASSITTGASGGGGCTFYNLSITQPVVTVAKTNTLTGNLTVNNTLTISGTSCTFSCGTGNTVDLLGTLTIGTASTFAGGSSTINITGGNWLNSIGLPFSYGTSTVVLNKTTAAQSITRASGETFYNLTLNNTSGTSPQITIAKPVTVLGALTMTSGIVSTTSTNVLTMGAGSITTIGSATAYIDGPMIYNVAAAGVSTIHFPIGKSTSYRPFTLNVNHTNVTSVAYTGELINTSAVNLGYTVPGTLTHVSLVRYWQIDRAAVANFTDATVTLYYNTTGLNDFVNDFANLAVAKTVGAGVAWFDFGGVATGNNSGSITSDPFTSFSKFTLANKSGGSNSLPIELISFTGKLNENGATELKWTTATEQNSDYFMVQKSKNAKDFGDVVKVKAAGNSNVFVDYKAIDTKPFEGTSFYRLKQVDQDGITDYSDLITIENNKELKFSLYPNPMNGNNLRIDFENELSNEDIQVALYDNLGKLIFFNNYQMGEESQKLMIDFPAKLTSGVYFITIVNSEKSYKQKIIVQ